MYFNHILSFYYSFNYFFINLFHLFIYIIIYLFNNTSIYVSILLTIYSSTHLFMSIYYHLSIHPHISLCIYLFNYFRSDRQADSIKYLLTLNRQKYLQKVQFYNLFYLFKKNLNIYFWLRFALANAINAY